MKKTNRGTCQADMRTLFPSQVRVESLLSFHFRSRQQKGSTACIKFQSNKLTCDTINQNRLQWCYNPTMGRPQPSTIRRTSFLGVMGRRGVGCSKALLRQKVVPVLNFAMFKSQHDCDFQFEFQACRVVGARPKFNKRGVCISAGICSKHI